MEVRIDLYAEAQIGTYTVDVLPRPRPRPGPGDLLARSADLVLDESAAKPGARRLVFTPAVTSPLGLGVLERPGCIVTAFLYHPKDDTALLAFDARITEDYSAFYATRGVYYTGTFRVVGPDGPCIAEILVYDTADRAEAEEMGSVNLPPHITAMAEEGQALQDLARRRYLIWLIPRG